MTRDHSKTLEIEGPTATCGACRFTSALSGTWSIEDGRLVWRGDPDPQPGRGPDLSACAEGWNCPDKFMCIEVDGEALNAEDVAALRAAANETPLYELDERSR